MSYTPPVIQHTEWGQSTPDSVHLFTIVKGETSTEYAMPAEKNAGMLLEYLRIARMSGEAVASSWLVERAVGREGYLALCAEPNLEGDLLKSLGKRITSVIAGTAPDIFGLDDDEDETASAVDEDGNPPT